MQIVSDWPIFVPDTHRIILPYVAYPGGGALIWGEISCVKTIDDLREGVAAKIREKTYEQWRYVLLTSSKRSTRTIEFLKYGDGGPLEVMGRGTMEYTDREKIKGIFEYIGERPRD